MFSYGAYLLTIQQHVCLPNALTGDHQTAFKQFFHLLNLLFICMGILYLQYIIHLTKYPECGRLCKIFCKNQEKQD